MEGYQWGEGEGRMGGKVQRIRSINGWYKRDGEVKDSMANVEFKELTYMTHEHELRWENASGRVSRVQREIKRRKKWDNCNSIINKYI